MTLTIIDEDNIKYFKNAIGERYNERMDNELFAGVMDDDKNAVAAGVFEETPEGLFLSFIAVSEEKRRQGIGTFLLNGIAKLAKNAGINSMDTVFYLDEKNEGAKGFQEFLKYNGFEINEIEGKRSVYDIYKIKELPPFTTDRLRRPYRIKSSVELNEKEKEMVLAIDNPMINPYDFISLKNRYGGVLFNKDEICAMLVAEPFNDGIRIGSIYGDGEGVSMFPYLFEHAREVLERESMEIDELYVDTVGEKTAFYEEMLLGKMGMTPVRSYNACGAILDLARR